MVNTTVANLMKPHFLLRLSPILALAVNAFAAELPPGRVLDASFYHLGDNVVTKWPEAPAEPGGFNLDIRFEAKANESEMLLGLTQRDVDNPWTLRLNGKKIGELKKGKDRVLRHYAVPAGALKDGENILNIASRSKDDITVGGVMLYDASLRELLDLQVLQVTAVDEATGDFLPVRITVMDQERNRVEIYYAETGETAVRKGVLYTLGKPAALELPPGDYRVAATHGTEWSMAEEEVRIRPGAAPSVRLVLRRELETPGFISADTHIHTLTFSGHGDSSVEERMVTLAAENVELAVATDHNHQTDYEPYQTAMKLNGWFTSVTGNEVTTRNGHFNSFPLPPGKDIPAYKEDNWEKLVAGIRAKGARVVILNHPRWPDIARGPFGRFGLNRASGGRASGGAFTFDAMELINSGTLQPDPLYLCRDWFSLLNQGERITAVGSSDSHTVGNIVGQGRTYVRSSAEDPGAIDIGEACDAFLRGDTTISMGIITDLTVNETFHMGDTVNAASGVAVDLRVAAPSWVVPRKAVVYLNGVAAATKPVPVVSGKPTDVRLRFAFEAPEQDAWLVCVVLGDAVTHPAWATEEAYTFAASNPVYLDATGDGYRSPRATAETLIAAAVAEKRDPLDAALQQKDGIAIQMIDELRDGLESEARGEFDEKLREASSDRAVLKEYLRYLPTTE